MGKCGTLMAQKWKLHASPALLTPSAIVQLTYLAHTPMCVLVSRFASH